MTSPLPRYPDNGFFTVDDLDELPSDRGFRYELFDGSLLVTPAAEFSHAGSVTLLRDLLVSQAPPGHMHIENVGVYVSPKKYYVPDLVVVRRERFDTRHTRLIPADILLAVEVLSPSNRSNDLVMKRHAYAAAGIPEYWIVDERERTLTVLRLSGDTYAVHATARPGEPYSSDRPYPLLVDPAAVF